MDLAERLEKRLNRGIKEPFHSLGTVTDDYIVFDYNHYWDGYNYQKAIEREMKLLYKSLKQLKRFAGTVKYVWINDYVINIDDLN